MSEFQVGEIVDITIKGVRVINSYPTRRDHEDTGTVLVVSYDAADESRSVAVNLAATEVSVDRVAPAEWPPQRDDVWADRGGIQWFVIVRGSSVDMVNGRGRQISAAQLMRDCSPLALVYRRESDGDQS